MPVASAPSPATSRFVGLPQAGEISWRRRRLGYGLLFVVIGFALTYGLWRTDKIFMLLPLAAGFMLLVPLLSVGFQATSRDIEQNRRPSFSAPFLRGRPTPNRW
jgi:uncharacterized membrane protein